MSSSPPKPPPGLCDTCVWRTVITSDRGSVFYLCAKSKTDPAFDKYPRLPVLRCSGYQPPTASDQSPR